MSGPIHKKKYLAPSPTSTSLSGADAHYQSEIGKRLASVLGITPLLAPPLSSTGLGDVYYLPYGTLLIEEAKKLAIRSSKDLYGGVVPHDFLRYKTVSHPIYHPTMAQPDGWNNELGEALRPYVLPGFSAFSTQDILWTARGMLHQGPIRLKLAQSNASQGQYIFNHHAEVSAFLNQAPLQSLFEQGVSLEEDIQNSTTFSVGQTEINDHLLSYFGEQSVTPNLIQRPTYGGSKLFVVRGGYEELRYALNQPHYDKALYIVQEYERLIINYYPEIFASRRNYDVLQGTNFHGEPRLGVLEHSWRMGGASMAEITALDAFMTAPELKVIHTWTRERYYRHYKDIPDPQMAYCIIEDQGGFVAKYAGVW